MWVWVPTIGGTPLVGWSAPVVLTLAVLMVLFGRLIPRMTYEDMVKDRDHYQQAHAVSEKQRVENAKQIDMLLEYGETVDDILHALPVAVEQVKEDSQPRAVEGPQFVDAVRQEPSDPT